MFSFSTSIEGCLFLSTPFISSVAAEAFWIKQGGYFWLFGFCSRRTDLYVYPGNDLLNHTFEQSQRAPCLHLPQPVLRALPQCGFHYKQEPLQHFLPYYSIFHYAGRRTTRENQPLLRKELIKPIGGQKCFSTHMYFCQRCDDGEWVEPYPISVVQQRDIIRINWEWTSRLSLNLRCAEVIACSSGIFVQFGCFSDDPTKECYWLPAHHLSAAPC